MDFKYAKIVVFAPRSHAWQIRQALADCGAGHVGNYDSCSFSSKGTGRFRGKEGTKPFVGKSGKVEEVKEEKIETICPIKKVDKIVEGVKKVHPYEEPAIDIYPLLNK